MIKILLKRNSIHLFALYSSYFIRRIIGIIIDKVFVLDLSYIYLFSMTIGEAVGGLSAFLYNIHNFKKTKEEQSFETKLIYNKIELTTTDGFFKKISLIIFAGSYDILEYILAVFYIPNIAKTSSTIRNRLGCLSTVLSSLLCVYALGFRIGKHHKFALMCLGVCFVATLSLEFIFKPEDQPLDRFIFAHFLIIIFLMSISCNDCIERYLAYYNYINPFQILMLEGIYETLMAIFYSINKDPFRGLIDGYEKNNAGGFVLLIFLLLIYLILCGVVNVYKVYCNVRYNPMKRSLTEYFLNPVLNIYYLLVEDDFHKNYLLFTICEVLCLITDFTFYLYNEFLVLFCCNLAHDTGDEIYIRSITLDEIPLETIEDEEENAVE